VSVRLEWDGKPTQVERISLPFQTVETINESRATRERDSGSLLGGGAQDTSWRNLLIWGDNKLVMSSLLREFAGQVKLIYIDPPFETGSDFSHRVLVGDEPLTKLPSILEEHAYRDTWAQGRGSYLSMLYDRVALIHELLEESGVLFLHIGANVGHYVKVICDEIFGASAFVNEITWKRSDAHSDIGQGAKHLGRIHDLILFYAKGADFAINMQYTPLPKETADRWYRHVEPETGRRYNLADISGPGGAAKGNPRYEFLGVTRYWRYSQERMQELYDQGLVVQRSPGTVPARKALSGRKQGRLVARRLDRHTDAARDSGR
jgi:adenine-specific DNA-methyltransferase